MSVVLSWAHLGPLHALNAAQPHTAGASGGTCSANPHHAQPAASPAWGCWRQTRDHVTLEPSADASGRLSHRLANEGLFAPFLPDVASTLTSRPGVGREADG